MQSQQQPHQQQQQQQQLVNEGRVIAVKSFNQSFLLLLFHCVETSERLIGELGDAAEEFEVRWVQQLSSVYDAMNGMVAFENDSVAPSAFFAQASRILQEAGSDGERALMYARVYMQAFVGGEVTPQTSRFICERQFVGFLMDTQAQYIISNSFGESITRCLADMRERTHNGSLTTADIINPHEVRKALDNWNKLLTTVSVMSHLTKSAAESSEAIVNQRNAMIAAGQAVPAQIPEVVIDTSILDDTANVFKFMKMLGGMSDDSVAVISNITENFVPVLQKIATTASKHIGASSGSGNMMAVAMSCMADREFTDLMGITGHNGHATGSAGNEGFFKMMFGGARQ